MSEGLLRNPHWERKALGICTYSIADVRVSLGLSASAIA